MLGLMFDQTFRQFELVSVDKLAEKCAPHFVVGFIRGLLLHVSANLRAQLFQRFNLFTKALGPVIVKLRQLLDPNRTDLNGIIDLLAGKALGAKIRRVVNGESLFVVGLCADQLIRNFLHYALTAQHDVDILDVNWFSLRLFSEGAVKARRHSIANLGAAIFHWLERSRVFPQRLNDFIDIFVLEGTRAASDFKALIVAQFYLWQDLDADIE